MTESEFAPVSPIIECIDLTKTFGAFTAVDRLSLTVRPGELFGFLGPNGAGKTTTIRMLVGLLHISSGSAAIGGYDVARFPTEVKRIVGYVPDNPFLYEKLTGREFLAFMADLYSVSSADRSRRIPELLHLFDLEDKADELIQSYSRGMRQKIALSGALIHSPRVIFLDEPTVGLDPRGARTMRDTLRELCNRGVAVFMSTHILEVAERMCDQIAIINRSRIVAQGGMAELREHASAQGSPEGESRTLEDIFLELTGDTENEDPAAYLS